MYEIQISHPMSAKTRHVPASLSKVTWGFDNTKCLYAGNAEGGPVAEVDHPNDSLIEGELQDYGVTGMFSTAFRYQQFKKASCT